MLTQFSAAGQCESRPFTDQNEKITNRAQSSTNDSVGSSHRIAQTNQRVSGKCQTGIGQRGQIVQQSRKGNFSGNRRRAAIGYGSCKSQRIHYEPECWGHGPMPDYLQIARRRMPLFLIDEDVAQPPVPFSADKDPFRPEHPGLSAHSQSKEDMAAAAGVIAADTSYEAETEISEGWESMRREMPSVILWLKPSQAWLRATDPRAWPEREARIASIGGNRKSVPEHMNAVETALTQLCTKEAAVAGFQGFQEALRALSAYVASQRAQDLHRDATFRSDLLKGIQAIVIKQQIFWRNDRPTAWRNAYSELQAHAAEWFLSIGDGDALQEHCRYYS
jgi:hypothetical protein